MLYKASKNLYKDNYKIFLNLSYNLKGPLLHLQELLKHFHGLLKQTQDHLEQLQELLGCPQREFE